MQYLEARSKGRVVSNPGRDSRQGLDVAYLSALTTAAKLAEEEMRIQNHFVTQTMSLKVMSALDEESVYTCYASHTLSLKLQAGFYTRHESIMYIMHSRV